jgi:6-phosphogluconolactonase
VTGNNRMVVAYVSCAGSGEVFVLGLDTQHGTLHELQRVALGGTLMPMAPNPSHKRLYVARRSPPLAVLSLGIAADGRLTLLGEASLPASMAYIAADRSGRFVLSASYGEHQLAVNSIDADGVAGPVLQVVATEPNAHAVQAAPSNRHIFATSLGGGLLRRFDFDVQCGRLTPHAEPRVAIDGISGQAAGPRHMAFHPNGRWLYVLNELDATIIVFDFNSANGATTPLQRIGSLPSAFSGTAWAAEIRIASHGRHLYTSERGASTLAAFSIDAADGRLALIGHQPTQTQPRGFALDPGGRWLVAAGQRSHRVCVHAIDTDSGALGPAGASLQVGTDPNWVEIIALS